MLNEVLFQSTLPMRGATEKSLLPPNLEEISIHTPHAGSDLQTQENTTKQEDFNPHSPCGERQHRLSLQPGFHIFQSTLPMRGATNIPDFFNDTKLISIHTPHAGSDQASTNLSMYDPDFNPHSPCGERRHRPGKGLSRHRISIHTPHAGSDLILRTKFLLLLDFNPHSPCGERQQKSHIY